MNTLVYYVTKISHMKTSVHHIEGLIVAGVDPASYCMHLLNDLNDLLMLL